ncbi:MAG: tetratricopeptide repeat protein [Anaerolineae bacterium]|nr:tetratricopeptide repeat protein [Anaerolineae bacterium]
MRPPPPLPRRPLCRSAVVNARPALGLAMLMLLAAAVAACSSGDPSPTPVAEPMPTTMAVAPAPATSLDAARGSPPQALSAGPTPTPSPAPTATPSPTPTLPPSPTPTPLPALGDLLAEARQHHDDGDYAAARRLYALIVEQAPDAPEGHEARWRLGLAYLEDDQPTEAFVALSLARAHLPPEALPPEVDFWLAELAGRLGNPTAAVEAYRRYLAQEDALAGEVHLRIGRLLRQAGDLEAADEALRQAVAAAPDNFVRFAALEELAEVALAQERWADAVAHFDQILAVSRLPRYRAEIQQRAGQALERSGQRAAAAERYRRALAEDEKSPAALAAVNALEALGQPVDDYTRGRVLLGNGYLAEGVAAIYRYLDATPTHPAEPHLLVAEAYFGRREYAKAIAEWQAVLDTHPEHTDRASVLMRQAAAYGRLGNPAQARALYRSAAAASAAKAPAAGLEAARLAEREGNCAAAATEYLDVARLYPNAAEAGEALFRGGVCQYRLGQRRAALESWTRLIESYPANTYAHAGRFWAGKAALELGDVERAAELWQRLSREAADSYYTARAAELAGAVPDGQAPMGSPSEEALMAEAERWLAGWAGATAEDPAALRRLPAAVADDPQLRRGEAYLRAGLRAEALRELDGVRERFKNDPLALYALALHFRDLGVYRHSIQAAVRLGALGPGGLFEAPIFVQRLAYPTYFSHLVEREAAARGVDPLLIYALIRQESFFERGARSVAAAQGLTQVIPSTAEWIANAIGWRDFRPTDIYKPYVNIKFGVYYLWAALQMFDGNVYPALVGYNAGPGNARYWLEQADTDDNDLYVEEITVAEPKLYVRRVLAHYAQYRRLYGESAGPTGD